MRTEISELINKNLSLTLIVISTENYSAINLLTLSSIEGAGHE
jgi:hypothetical protein